MIRSKHLRIFVMLASSVGLTMTGCTSSLLNTAMLKTSSFKPAILDGHGTEQRVITLFTDAIGENNEPALRRIVSTRFEQKALRAKDSFKDLEILNLPKSKLEVVESKELEDNKYEAVAKDEKTGTKYQFIIVRDVEKKRWAVDDVMLRQQKKGTRATKSSVEVMDLLLTIREFLDTWENADRSAVLQAVSTELRTPLEKLPEPWLQQLIARVSSEYETGMARRPEAQMNESDAIVKMPSKNGFLILNVAREDEQWLVSNIEVRLRKSDDHPGSILRQARAMNAVTSFLGAYSAQDQIQLQKYAEDKFYKNSLSIGDLSMIPLPSPDHAPDDFEIQSFAGQLTVMIPDQENVVRVDLTTPEVANAKDDRKRAISSAIESEFIIADVTIYDRQSHQQQNLRSAFTAPARAMLFLSALQTRDLPMLKQTSATSLSESVWNKMDPALLGFLPLTGIPTGEMTLQSSRVQGAVTELEFLSSSGQLCNVLLRDENGSLKVEDVQYPDSFAMIASLRTQMTLTVPVIELAQAWESGNLDSVKRTSSLEFNRLVWSNLTSLPPQFDGLPDLLRMPVQKTKSGEQRSVLELSTPGQPSVMVSLLKENTAWVVDEISMRQADGTNFELRKSLRRDIAQQFLVDPSGGIQQAHFDGEPAKNGSGVVRAGGFSEAPRGNLTVQSYGKPAAKSAMSSQAIDMTEDLSAMGKRDETGTLRFGPAALTQENPFSGAAAGKPLPARDHALAPAEEHDGVVYFKADSASKTKTDGHRMNSASPQRHAPIMDPSQHPIEIPME